MWLRQNQGSRHSIEKPNCELLVIILLQPNTSYFICCTPRSGSTLLCEALQNTELAGWPEEYFLEENMSNWKKQWDISTFQEYLGRTLQEGSTTNGVFGAKVMMGNGYFEHFSGKLSELP
ncbi:MAG: Stf0 family sulfotransferase, partial [Candidatus Electrothrix sp.]